MATEKHLNARQKAYQLLRNEIKTGDLLFCVGNYPISKLIGKFSDSEFSHIGIIYRWNNRVLLMESVEDDGVRTVPLSQYIYDYENSGNKYNGKLYLARHTQFPTDENLINTVFGHGSDLLNKSYDKSVIGKVALRVVLGIGRNEKNDEYICSEFVESCLNIVGLKFKSDRGFVYPEHIAAHKDVDFLNEIIG